jgi:hypothetical protein
VVLGHPVEHLPDVEQHRLGAFAELVRRQLAASHGGDDLLAG